jgi:hypothetical protein
VRAHAGPNGTYIYRTFVFEPCFRSPETNRVIAHPRGWWIVDPDDPRSHLQQPTGRRKMLRWVPNLKRAEAEIDEYYARGEARSQTAALDKFFFG